MLLLSLLPMSLLTRAPSRALGVIPKTVPNYRCVGTRVPGIAPGVLLRSATPANASAADAALISAEVRTVLDLRSEKDAGKDAGPRRLALATKHLPLLNQDMIRQALLTRAKARPVFFSKVIALGLAKKLSPSRRLRKRLGRAVDTRLASLLGYLSLADIYWLILSERQAELRAALELCTQAEALPLLVHCTHGKDRTGVFVALLLSACGIDEDAIVADYVQSDEWGCSVDGRHLMLHSIPDRLRPHVSDETVEAWCAAPEEQIRDLFGRIKASHGTVEAYLDSIGVRKAVRHELALRFTSLPDSAGTFPL